MSGNMGIGAIGSEPRTNAADKVKKYKEKFNEVMAGIGSTYAKIDNVWQNGLNGNIDVSGVSVWNNREAGSCATNM